MTMMPYIKVDWKHEHSDFPIQLYSELDDARWEVRKVEVFRDESLGYADRVESRKPTFLGLKPIPPLSEIATNPEFEPTEIAKDEFEEIWSKALRKAH
jgi:hypothetical protein